MDQDICKEKEPYVPEIILPSAYSYGGFVQTRTAPASLPSVCAVVVTQSANSTQRHSE